VIGTRPEAIKMAPVVRECRRRAPATDPIVCLTGQHSEMLRQAVEYFELHVDVDLDLMRPDQTLSGLSARCLESLDRLLVETKPHCVVAQGDTTTVLATSLAAFHRRIPFVHVEAGLRTGDLQAPWPEELNRRVADMAASLHCAPTRRAADRLLAEGASPGTVHVTGNTVIDALLQTVERERVNGCAWRKKYALLADDPMILVTCHRRESLGEGISHVCRAIRCLAERFGNHHFVYPVHLNPHVQEPVRRFLGSCPNVHLIPPAPYPEFVWLMDRSELILTDSGGVQEEAPSLRKPVLLLRDTTERPEALEAGAVRKVGTSVDAIVQGVTTLLTDPVESAACRIENNPYGDGQAAPRIVELMLQQNWC
jgi:UDP-N-acetylglucosamine 2-epimerase (non-hydrolysing)